MLDDLAAEGTSILLTTHHLDEAQERTDRIVVIDHGKVVANGTIDELIDGSVGSARMVRLRVDRPLERTLTWLPRRTDPAKPSALPARTRAPGTPPTAGGAATTGSAFGEPAIGKPAAA